MARRVEHDITLLAMTRNEDGTLSLHDIVETSFHHAYRFVSRWLRDDQIAAIGTQRAPRTGFTGVRWRDIR